MNISLLREIAQAISHLNPERALHFLVESAITVTESKGAVLMVPHEKIQEMVPLVENISDSERNLIKEGFLAACYMFFYDGCTTAFDPEAFSPSWRSGYSVLMPVKLAGKGIALLFIFRSIDGTQFNNGHQSFLEILTPFLGTLIENFRLHNEMIHKNSRLSALYEISQRAESMINLKDVFDGLGKVVQSFIDYDSYFLYLLLPDGQTLEAKIGNSDGPFPGRIKLGDGPIGLAALQRKPHLTYTEKFKSVLILPILVSEKLIGVVSIASRKSYAYRDEDIIGLRIITTQIASIDEMFKDLLRLRGFTEHILESMTSGVLIFDPNFKVIFSNHEMSKFIGQSIPDNFSKLSEHPTFPPGLRKILADVLESKTALENERLRIEEMTPPVTLEVNAFPFRDEHGIILGTAFFFKDITQIIRLEDRLKRADRLSALGVLAAGIAHEIRNPLTGMKMIVQLLAGEFGENDPKREPLGIVQKEIDRLERIIVNLLDFAKPSKPQAVNFAIVETMNACLLLLQNQLCKSLIRLEKNYPEISPQVLGDPDQIKQVFLNILTNAIQASKSGGSLVVSIETRPNWAVVSVKDNGVGITRERIKSIFDPFMTTKEDGTGLGLSMALRIVEEHGGRIEVESCEGTGSTFSIFLPQRNEPKETV